MPESCNGVLEANGSTRSRATRTLRLSEDQHSGGDSSETESSFVTAGSHVSVGSGLGNKQSIKSEVARNLLNTRRLQAYWLCFKSAICLGGFGLGTVFLVLDILHSHPKRLSIYHSFAPWLPLVAVIIRGSMMLGKPLVLRIAYQIERRGRLWIRRDSGASTGQSQSSSRTSSDSAAW